MKRRVVNCIGILIMAGAIAFSLAQLRIPVVRADGCPSNPFPECMCYLSGSTTVYDPFGGPPVTTCIYNCACGGGGGGEFFEIEREYVY